MGVESLGLSQLPQDVVTVSVTDFQTRSLLTANSGTH